MRETPVHLPDTLARALGVRTRATLRSGAEVITVDFAGEEVPARA